MIFKKFFTLEYFSQNTKKIINEHVYFISQNNLLFNKPISLRSKSDLSAHYSFNNSLINIPENFFKNDINYKQYINIEKSFNEKSLNFIIFHEIAHLNNHQFLSLHLNSHTEKFEYIILTSKSNYIKTNTSLDNLFDRTLLKDNPIDDFIHMNFTESYADAYAGLVSYIQDKDISIFDKINQFRCLNINNLQKNNVFNYKKNEQSHLEITRGKFSTSRYSNHLVSDYIKNNITKTFSNDQINSFTIDKLHALLQIEVLKSLNQTLKNEINNNSLFSNDFNKYLLIKNISVDTYFNKFEIGIKEYQNKTILNIIQSSFINQNKDLLVNFIDFHIKHKFTNYTFKVPLLTESEESDITSSIIESINDGRKMNHLLFSKIIFNKHILPINEFDSFMSYLEKKDTSNPKFTEIVKSLSPDLINSLIQYNNLPISTTPTPTINHYSKQDLIDIITKDLSVKDKKQFVDYIEKNNIKEITTTYLSSSDFNVANETQFQPKSTSKILSIENKTKPHNEANQNEVQKIKIK